MYMNAFLYFIYFIIIMYIYHALINALSAHMIHINLNMIFNTHILKYHDNSFRSNAPESC